MGSLTAAEGGYEFAYLPAAVERLGEGAIALSYSLPVRVESYGAAAARPYFEGLLPDGGRRARFALELGLDPDDTLGLLAELGGDCPGAVLVLPEGERPGEPDPSALSWATDAELEELTATPPERLFDPDDPRCMRFAWPGERHVLALVRDEERDRWAWPQPGMPSTHVVRPETGEYPDLVLNEIACTAALRAIGLPLSPLEPMTVGGQLCAVAARRDRVGERLPVAPRHLETFWQALGFPPGAERAVEDRDRPGFEDSAILLREIGEPEAVQTLFRFGFACFMLGDHPDDIIERRDLHGRNCSLLLHDGAATLGPFDGVFSSVIYESDEDTARTLFEWALHSSGYAGLMRVGVECGQMPQPSIATGLEMTIALGQALDRLADRAQREDWYRLVLDHIVCALLERGRQLQEDINQFVRGPDGRTLGEAVEELQKRRRD